MCRRLLVPGPHRLDRETGSKRARPHRYEPRLRRQATTRYQREPSEGQRASATGRTSLLPHLRAPLLAIRSRRQPLPPVAEPLAACADSQ
jgi:hypothetical protein